MLFNMIGADGETETTIRIKLWPIISLIIAGMLGLGLYVSNHESRLCVTEKAAETTAAAVAEVKRDSSKLTEKLDQIARDQELYYSLREPKWAQWKEWNERKRKNGNGGK